MSNTFVPMLNPIKTLPCAIHRFHCISCHTVYETNHNYSDFQPVTLQCPSCGCQYAVRIEVPSDIMDWYTDAIDSAA